MLSDVSWTSAARLMESVAGMTSPALVSADAWQRVIGVAECLPAAAISTAYLECRLASQSSRIDWIVRVDPDGAPVLAGGLADAAVLPMPEADRVWNRVRRFCAAWADDARLRVNVRSLWLEFDLERSGGPHSTSSPPPSVFIGFQDPSQVDWMCAATVIGLLLPEASPQTIAKLRGAIGKLPRGVGVPFLGFMLGRSARALRLYVGVGQTRGDAIPAIARRLGWEGDIDELLNLLRCTDPGQVEMRPRYSMFHVDIDIDVLPQIGIERLLRRGPQVRGRVAELEFLNHLVAIGLCSAEKRDGMLRWPGGETIARAHGVWPSAVSRRVNCLKIAYDPGANPQIKGYLAASWSAAGEK